MLHNTYISSKCVNQPIYCIHTYILKLTHILTISRTHARTHTHTHTHTHTDTSPCALPACVLDLAHLQVSQKGPRTLYTEAHTPLLAHKEHLLRSTHTSAFSQRTLTQKRTHTPLLTHKEHTPASVPLQHVLDLARLQIPQTAVPVFAGNAAQGASWGHVHI
jgi:hypothetical protein